EGVRLDVPDGVERGCPLVVRLDPGEILLDEGATGQRAIGEGRLDLRDGRFLDLKWPWDLSGERRRGEEHGGAGEAAHWRIVVGRVGRVGQVGRVGRTTNARLKPSRHAPTCLTHPTYPTYPRYPACPAPELRTHG